MNQLDSADRAVRLGPSNPEAHYVRARLLENADRSQEAIKEFELAVALRPNDYVLWLALGRALDQANDSERALAAFRESARLAPFYSQPHWLLGNTLFRTGGRDEAFAELRRASQSDPRLLPQTMNMAWAAFRPDAGALERALQPQTPFARLALASFFARHGKASDAIAQVRLAGGCSNDERRTLLADLLNSKAFVEAFEVWSGGHQSNATSDPKAIGSIINGGFEEPISLNDPGFGWQLAPNLTAVRISIDPTGAHGADYNLRVDWSGDSDPSVAVASQLVLVQANTRYQLTFAVRTQDLLTIGFPVVAVTDAGSDKAAVLGESKPFPRGTTGWQDYTFEFATAGTTTAVLLVIRRQSCAITPCAIIGHAWVDDFSLKQL